MAEESNEEKTEAPSEKKRHDAREKGNVAKSTEINSVIILLTALFMMKILGPWIIKELSSSIVEFMKNVSETQMDYSRLMMLMRKALILLVKTAAPIAGGIMLMGVVANVVQVGFLFTLKPLMPKLEKINPVSGFSRFFSMRSIVETLKNIVKLVLIICVAYITLKKEFLTMLTLADASVLSIWAYVLAVSYKVILRIALAMVIIAILDYAYQRFEHEKQLKMTHQEVKEERKQLEGDPQVKARIRSLQREMARRRMMEQVPKATVVVTNPTHLAIALRYEPKENDAPVVVAKGKDLIAQKIKKLAQENDVPVVEDKPLARSMYDKVEVGFPIPVEFFTAVAEIMAYVYRLKNRNAA
jgi:flagellar biosynthetic protein FlhB